MTTPIIANKVILIGELSKNNPMIALDIKVTDDIAMVSEGTGVSLRKCCRSAAVTRQIRTFWYHSPSVWSIANPEIGQEIRIALFTSTGPRHS